MNEHGGAFVRAMVEKSDDSRVVEILITDVIANLHANMPGAHAASEFGAGSVNILQGHLAERAESAFAASTELQRRIIKYSSATQGMFRFTIVAKQHRRDGNDLVGYAVAIHFFQARIRIPARRRDMTEHPIADHDHSFTRLGVLDRRPIRRAESRRKIGPRFREEVCVNVDDWHFVSALRNTRYFFTGFPG
jgi:hypothetical protein